MKETVYIGTDIFGEEFPVYIISFFCLCFFLFYDFFGIATED